MLARCLFKGFALTKAATWAMHSLSLRAAEFFGKFINPSLDVSFPKPTEHAPGSDLDGNDGIGLEPSIDLNNSDSTEPPVTPQPSLLHTLSSHRVGDELLYNNILFL